MALPELSTRCVQGLVLPEAQQKMLMPMMFPLSRACWVIESVLMLSKLVELLQLVPSKIWTGSDAFGVGRAFAAGLSKIWTSSSDEDVSTLPNSCPLQHRVADLKFPLPCVFKSFPSYTWIVPFIESLVDTFSDVSNLCRKTPATTSWGSDSTPKRVRNLMSTIWL